MKETDIQLAVCDYLAYKGYFFWRQNVVPVYQDGRFYSLPKYSKRGIPDIILIKDGKFIGLEVKTPKGRQSENQKLFEEQSKDAGAEYHLIRSLDDLPKLGL